MACAFGHAHWQLVYKSAPGEGQTVTAVTVLSLLKGKKKAADAGEVSRPAAFCLLSGGGGLLGVDWLNDWLLVAGLVGDIGFWVLTG